MREIRTLRARWRELETEPRTLLNGHEGRNLGYSQAGVLRAIAPVPEPTQASVTIDEPRAMHLRAVGLANGASTRATALPTGSVPEDLMSR